MTRFRKTELSNSHSDIPEFFMDRTGIIVVSLCVVLLVAWFVETQKHAVATGTQQQAPTQRH